jgi:hypothetical protein
LETIQGAHRAIEALHGRSGGRDDQLSELQLDCADVGGAASVPGIPQRLDDCGAKLSGSLRRECLGHVVILSAGLRRVF